MFPDMPLFKWRQCLIQVHVSETGYGGDFQIHA